MPKVKYLKGTYYERVVNGKKILLAYYGRYKDKHKDVYQFGGLGDNWEHIKDEEQVSINFRRLFGKTKRNTK